MCILWPLIMVSGLCAKNTKTVDYNWFQLHYNEVRMYIHVIPCNTTSDQYDCIGKHLFILKTFSIDKNDDVITLLTSEPKISLFGCSPFFIPGTKMILKIPKRPNINLMGSFRHVLSVVATCVMSHIHLKPLLEWRRLQWQQHPPRGYTCVVEAYVFSSSVESIYKRFKLSHVFFHVLLHGRVPWNV